MLATYQEKRIGLKLSRLCLMNRVFSSNSTAVADEHVMTFRSVVDQQHLANPRSTSTGLSGGNADGRTAEHLVAVRSDPSLTVTNNGDNLIREGN